MAVVHVVGAGLAGLACAVRLAGAGRRVALYEAAGHAGGRCRSLREPMLGRDIDNGNHLLLAGNDATMAYLATIGAHDSLATAPEVIFPFLDLRSGERWTLRPNSGRIPWWLFSAARRVPGSRPADYLAALRLARADTDATIAEVLDASTPFFERFWEPFVVAILNARPDEASARLLWPVMKLTFGRGGRACRGFVARDGLSASLVEPALAWLDARGCGIAYRHRLRSVGTEGAAAVRLDFGDRVIEPTGDDRVVLALPPARIAELLPGARVPRQSRAIVNAHFRLPRPAALAEGSPFLGLVGGAAQWLFLRGDIASVTVSAADAMVDDDADRIAARLWTDVARALAMAAEPLPPHRVVKERRATFAQTPAEVARRPPAHTRWSNLFLAGDWTDTGLPATIESAVCSGYTAARLALAP